MVLYWFLFKKSFISNIVFYVNDVVLTIHLFVNDTVTYFVGTGICNTARTINKEVKWSELNIIFRIIKECWQNYVVGRNKLNFKSLASYIYKKDEVEGKRNLRNIAISVYNSTILSHIMLLFIWMWWHKAAKKLQNKILHYNKRTSIQTILIKIINKQS